VSSEQPTNPVRPDASGRTVGSVSGSGTGAAPGGLPPDPATGSGTGPVGGSVAGPATGQPDAGPATGTTTSGTAPTKATKAPRAEVERTRVGGLWVVLVLSALVLLLLLIFILQNDQRVQISFLGLDGNLPLGVALLLASVFGIMLVAIPGTGRILQLRHAARRRAQQTRSAPRPSTTESGLTRPVAPPPDQRA
jgi:uncharacterized integral membrane protein